MDEKIVICGAGIAGVAAAHALAQQGARDVTLVEEGNPLSLTSDKSTEAYRNWWPGPDRAMTAFMDRSISLIEEIARATDNRINLNRRGYVFATADTSQIEFLSTMAQMAESRGGGAARFHDSAAKRLSRPRPSVALSPPSPARMSSPTGVSSGSTSRISRPTRSRSRMRAAPDGCRRSNSAP